MVPFIFLWSVCTERQQVSTVSPPNALATEGLKSTSCSGLPVDQSNSLRMGSSRQDAQTPLPAAQRKRTCCSLRSDTVTVCCEVTKTQFYETEKTRGKNYKDFGMILFFCLFGLPQSSYCPGWPRGLCSSIPPTGGCPWRGSSEWAAPRTSQEASQSVTAESSQLSVTRAQHIKIWCSLKRPTFVTLFDADLVNKQKKKSEVSLLSTHRRTKFKHNSTCSWSALEAWSFQSSLAWGHKPLPSADLQMGTISGRPF